MLFDQTFLYITLIAATMVGIVKLHLVYSWSYSPSCRHS